MPGFVPNGFNFGRSPVAKPLAQQTDQQTLAGHQNTFDRREQGVDFEQQRSQFLSLLGDLSRGGYIRPDTSSSSSTGSGSGGDDTYPGGTWRPMAPPPKVGLGNPSESGRAAFARAKDRIGQSTAGLMKALNNQFAGRGLSGGSQEVAAVGNTLLGAHANLADVTRAQAIKESDDANDFARTEYTGNITQRGQDIDATNADRNAWLTKRGQDVAARAAQSSSSKMDLASILGLYGAFNKPISSSRF